MKRLSKSILLIISILTFAAPAQAGFSLTTADLAKRQYTFELESGTQAEGKAVINNLSDNKIKIRFYGADATQSNMGTFALTTPSTEQHSLGKWIFFPENEITLEGKKYREILFSVNIPKDTPPGDYSGGITAESINEEEQNNSVSISSRIILKVFVSVPGEKKTAYEWPIFNFEKTDIDKPGSLVLYFKNTGNTIIKAATEITIDGIFIQPEKYEFKNTTLLPGKDLKLIQPWDNEPFFGSFKARAITTFSEFDIANNREINPQTVSKEITINIPLKTSTFWGKIVAITLGILIITIITILSWLIHLAFVKKHAFSYTVQENETLETISDKFGIKWKKIATTNKIKAPYNIKTGQILLIPRSKTK